jgi:hypothetical protein
MVHVQQAQGEVDKAWQWLGPVEVLTTGCRVLSRQSGKPVLPDASRKIHLNAKAISEKCNIA